MKIRIIILSTILISSSSFISAQNFSCGYGKKASCLDYNAKVVDSNSICFDEYVCGLNGELICKSKYDDIFYDHKDLLKKHNELVDNYNDVLNENQNLISEFNDLLSDHNKLESDNEELESDNDDLFRENQSLKSCIMYATSLEEANECSS